MQIEPCPRLMAMQVTEEESLAGIILFEIRSCVLFLRNTRISEFGILPEKPEKSTAVMYNSARVRTERTTRRTGEIAYEW